MPFFRKKTHFKNKILIILISAAIPLFTGCNKEKIEAPVIPLEHFFRNPDKAYFKLSPDGLKISFTAPWNNRMNVFVQYIDKDSTVRITSSSERDITYYFWANDNRLIYLQDTFGDEEYRLYAVNIDGTGHKDLTPFENTRAYVIDELEDIPDEILIALNMRDKKVFDAYRLNITTGDLVVEAQNPGNITEWITDHNGKIRAAITTDGVNTGYLYRENEIENFKMVGVTNFKNYLMPAAFTFDNKYVYAISNINRDKAALVIFDIANFKEIESVFEHYDVDVENIYLSKKNKKLTAVSFTTWKREYHFFDNDEKKLYEYLSKMLPGYEIAVVSRNRDEDKVFVRTYSDKTLGAYHLYNIKTNKLEKLAEISPWLKENEMADMKPITYKARDGLTIHGYLIVPNGVRTSDLPVIVYPHGGPWIRDRWGFDMTGQFFANRGYAVLMMNYRGSDGYGKKFWEAGFKEWGKGIQNDITDGVNWLVQQGIADPKRIGIYGYSFGGYCAMAGMTFTPELYKCGVDYVGMTNIYSFLESIPPYWESFREMLYEMVGDPVKDSILLHDYSPFFHVDKIEAPLLIAQGGNDPKVRLEDTKELLRILKKNRVTVQYIFKENEGHGFNNEENRIELYRKMENFLAKYLKGRTEKIE